MFWGILGGLCFAYFVVICIYAGIFSAFGWFWAACSGAGALLYFFFHKIPDKLQKAVWGIFFIGLATLILLEGKIIYYGNRKPQKGADYLIVLGCQIRGFKITRSLKYRLEKALEYGLENPNAVIIVSGGQGNGEAVSEAWAMQEYLVKHGIPEERVWKEDKSSNTYENMKFSLELIEKKREAAGVAEEGFRAVAVSNRFHIYRALRIGEKQGFINLEGLGAKTDSILAVSYYIREALAIFKDWLFGNLRF